MKKIFLDMDGVLVDFVSAALKAHNRPDPYVNGMYAGKRLEDVWEMSPSKFWEPMRGHEFWAKLKPTKEFRRIVRALPRTVQRAILTTPSKRDAESITGKTTWVRTWMPGMEEEIVFAKNKELIADWNSILVDDTDDVVETFRENGGRAILFPRPWNSRHRKSYRAYEVFEMELQTLLRD